MYDMPKTLEQAALDNTLIPFVGTGISIGVKNKDGKAIFKKWKESLLCAVHILEEEKQNKEATYIESALDLEQSSEEYLTIATKIRQYLKSQWNTYLTTTFDKSFETVNIESLKIAQEILKINNLVITTNYDDVLKWACENKNNLIEWDKKALHGQVESLKRNPDKQTIWYLHGKISNPDDIVFTKESYEQTYNEHSGAIEVLKHHLLTKHFLFCGFSLDDPYIKLQLETLKTVFGTNLSKHFMIVKKGQKKDFAYLGDIQFLEVEDYEEDYFKLLQSINALKNSHMVHQTSHIPTHIPSTPKLPFFNVPFESKKDDVVGMEGKLEEIYTKLNASKKLSIGQVAKFEGMGGLGKTQLAVEYAHCYKEYYPNGVIWLTMDQDFDEQLLSFGKKYALVNQNLDIQEQLKSIKHQFKAFENSLLVYDNTNSLEDIQYDFLPQSPANQILITTRNPIQGYTSIELQTLDLENSKRLLTIESGKAISSEDEFFVKTLCEKLDGLPLALEMAGAYVKYLSLSWKDYLTLYDKQSIELLDKARLPESFTKHENNIASTLAISQSIIDETPRLKEILNLLSYGANEPMDNELIMRLLSCDESGIIEAISIGFKLKYIKYSSQGYSIHRLLREVWKTQENLEQTFIDDVANNLSQYIGEIKDEFLNLSKLEKANLFSEQWSHYLSDNNTKAILLAYRAYSDYYKGNYEQALLIVKDADYIIEKKDSKEYAEILTYQGSLIQGSGYFPKAKDYFEQSYEMNKRLYLDQDCTDIASSLNNLGAVWYSLVDFQKAKDYFEQAFEMRSKLYLNHDHRHIANSLNSLGTIWESLKDFPKAKEFYEQSLEMKQRLYLNQDHPDLALSLNNLGSIWKSFGDFAKAQYFLEQAFEMRTRLYLNQDHPDLAGSLNNVGVVWYSLGNFTKAQYFLEQAFEMRKKIYSNQDHPDTINTMFSLSILLCQNLSTRKKGLDVLKNYKKIVKKTNDLQKIAQLIQKYEQNIGRDKSKRKKRK